MGWCHMVLCGAGSPYDNVKPAAYPRMLLTGGLNDTRVAYWEVRAAASARGTVCALRPTTLSQPVKFIAKVREANTGQNAVMVKVCVPPWRGAVVDPSALHADGDGQRPFQLLRPVQEPS